MEQHQLTLGELTELLQHKLEEFGPETLVVMAIPIPANGHVGGLPGTVDVIRAEGDWQIVIHALPDAWAQRRKPGDPAEHEYLTIPDASLWPKRVRFAKKKETRQNEDD